MDSQDEAEMLAKVFVRMGSSEIQALVMAKQMIKRADQLAEDKSISRRDALEHLMNVLIAGRKGEAYPPLDGKNPQ